MMSDPDPTSLRRFRFGLRSLFALVVIIAIPCAWVSYSLNWIRHRRVAAIHFAVNNKLEIVGTPCIVRQEMPDHNMRLKMTLLPRPRAPGGLWLLGERGVTCFALPSDASSEELEWARRTFSEAEVLQLKSGDD